MPYKLNGKVLQLGVGFQDVVAVLIPTFAVEAVPVTAVVFVPDNAAG